jgi:serine O-acetyltransferase
MSADPRGSSERSPLALEASDTGADLAPIVAALREARLRWRTAQRRAQEVQSRELPAREVLARVVEGLRGALFPMRLGPPELRPDSEDYYVGHTLDTVLACLRTQVLLELKHDARQRGQAPGPDLQDKARELVGRFATALPGIRELLDHDVLAAYRGDPAARSVDEVLLCYPGVRATIHHRLAHELYRLGAPLVARVIAELAHGETGIDIHPGAQIGPGLFIDHGTGVVIGETCIIGQRVRIYQNVTLGAKSFPAKADGSLEKGLPRHPVVEDDVVIYAGATVLGRITIGQGSVIGGNVWLTRGVPPGSQVNQADADTQCRPPAAGASTA